MIKVSKQHKRDPKPNSTAKLDAARLETRPYFQGQEEFEMEWGLTLPTERQNEIDLSGWPEPQTPAHTLSPKYVSQVVRGLFPSPY